MSFTAKQIAALSRVSGAARRKMEENFVKQSKQGWQNKKAAAQSCGRGQSSGRQGNQQQKPRQPQKPAPLRKARQGPKHHFAAMNKYNIPSPYHEGKALPYHGAAPKDIALASGQRIIGFFSNVGELATIGVSCQMSASTVQTLKGYTVPTLAVSAANGGCSSARSMKASVSLVCNTPVIKRGGRVYILNCDQRIHLPNTPTLMTYADWTTTINTVKSHPDVQRYDLSEFGTERECVCHVVNQPDYYTYDEWHGEADPALTQRFLDHLSSFPTAADTERRRPMSTVIIVIEGSADEQTITLTPRASWYTRHPLDTLPGQAMLTVPTTTLAETNQMNANAMSHANQLLSIATSAQETVRTVGELASMAGLL